MKIAVIYKSKTGFTKQYAEWIAEDLNCECLDFEKLNKAALGAYDYLIFGGRLSAGRIDGWKKFLTYVADHPNKKLAVFATGATPQVEKEHIDLVWNNNLSEAERKMVPHFYMQAGLNYEKMGFGGRMAMKIFAFILKMKPNKDAIESGTQQAISQSFDNSSREYIAPLVQCIKEQMSQ